MKVRASALPTGAILGTYADNGSYTDCYALDTTRPVTHAEFVEAFFTSGVFRMERWLIATFLSRRSTDDQVREFASGGRDAFAWWTVERRERDQLLAAAGRTRAWLMVGETGTTLYFGSAVVPQRAGGPMPWHFRAALGFHRRYSRALLAAAGRKLGA